METFLVDAREVIVIDHEHVNPKLNLAAGQDGVAPGADNVTKLQNHQDVSVMEITETPDGWALVKDSPLNRMIPHRLPM